MKCVALQLECKTCIGFAKTVAVPKGTWNFIAVTFSRVDNDFCSCFYAALCNRMGSHFPLFVNGPGDCFSRPLVGLLRCSDNNQLTFIFRHTCCVEIEKRSDKEYFYIPRYQWDEYSARKNQCDRIVETISIIYSYCVVFTSEDSKIFGLIRFQKLRFCPRGAITKPQGKFQGQ